MRFLRPQKPENQGKKTLVLDLDETLVHSTFTTPREGQKVPDMLLDVKWDDGIADTIYVNVRPFVNTFLKEMAEKFEIVIFTASIINYAQSLVQKLDVENKKFPILWRRH